MIDALREAPRLVPDKGEPAGRGRVERLERQAIGAAGQGRRRTPCLSAPFRRSRASPAPRDHSKDRCWPLPLSSVSSTQRSSSVAEIDPAGNCESSGLVPVTSLQLIAARLDPLTRIAKVPGRRPRCRPRRPLRPFRAHAQKVSADRLHLAHRQASARQLPASTISPPSPPISPPSPAIAPPIPPSCASAC